MCHRLTNLRRPGAEGIPFHLIRIDIAGNESAKSAAVKGSPSAEAPGGTTPGAVSTITTSKEIPWGLAFLPDGTMLVTQRDGKLRAMRGGKLDPNPVAGGPASGSGRPGPPICSSSRG